MGIQHCGKFKFWYNKFILNWRGQKNGIYKAIGDNRYIFTEWDIWKYPDKWNYYHERTLTTHLRKTSWRLKFIQKIWTKQCTKSWYYYKRWKKPRNNLYGKKITIYQSKCCGKGSIRNGWNWMEKFSYDFL